MARTRVNTLILAVLAMGTIAPVLAIRAAGAPTVGEAGQSSGKLTGLLVAKGDAWIEVRADGESATTKFRALWIGGMPRSGGGYEKKVLASIRKLVVPSRVSVKWSISEGPRVRAVEMIETPSPTGTARPEPTRTPSPEPTRTPRPEPTRTPSPEPTRTPRPEPTRTSAPEPTRTPRPEPTRTPSPEPTRTPRPEPTRTPSPEPTRTPRPEPTRTPTPAPTTAPTPVAGRARGIVIARGENWIDIRTEDVTRRFVPRWIGGMPSAGGGLDKEMLRLIASTPVGARVRYEWIFDERLRITVLAPDAATLSATKA